MNKFVKLGLLLLVLVVLTACGAKDNVETDENSEPVSQSESGISADSDSGEGDIEDKLWDQPRPNPGDNSMSPAMQLLLGAFLLEESEFAVDAEMAPDLMIYWKLYKTLLESDTTAPEELDAVIAEIQEVMTAEQLEYIASLDLIQEDLITFANESGILESLRPEGAEDGDGTRPDRPEGIGLGGGQGRGGLGNTEDMDPEMIATLQARRDEMSGTGGITNRLQIPMIEALLELLEGKLDSYT